MNCSLRALTRAREQLIRAEVTCGDSAQLRPLSQKKEQKIKELNTTGQKYRNKSVMVKPSDDGKKLFLDTQLTNCSRADTL
jgi:hypothetical protein